MPTFAYSLSFPCPDCAGMLTMHVVSGAGACPLCQCSLEVELTVKKKQQPPQEAKNELGYDKRAFRRPGTTSKPMWQPLHPPAE